MADLLRRAIPCSGEELPVVGLGTWQTFDVGAEEGARRPLEDVLAAFATLGGTVVDSSPMYGRAEAVVGDLAAGLHLHTRLFLATKVWTQGRAAGIRQMEDSLRKLKAPRVDLMQVHNLVDAETHLDTLSGWKAEGRVRYVGVTHYTASAHAALAAVLERHHVDFVQVNYSAVEREAEARILPIALDRGIAVLVNRPFAEGGVFRRFHSRPVPEWAAEIDCRSWAELLLKFVVSHEAVTCVIPATADVEHLRQNMRAGAGPMPDQALRARIASAVA